MMIVGNPSQAIRHSRLPNAGVGLARLEFIIASQIGIHPRALLEPESLDDQERSRVEEMIHGYDSGSDYYSQRLADGVAMIGAAFYPNDVIVRLTDFKSNEYRGLVGGRHFEPLEENPMLGWRGASRYSDPDYRDAFRLECRALRHVRDRMGLTNIKVMVPFVRTVAELESAIDALAAAGLERGVNGLQLYTMVEVPQNVCLLREFGRAGGGQAVQCLGQEEAHRRLAPAQRSREQIAVMHPLRRNRVAQRGDGRLLADQLLERATAILPRQYRVCHAILVTVPPASASRMQKAL